MTMQADEEACRQVLRRRLAYERTRAYSRFVSADEVNEAARELAQMRSRGAIQLLIKCVIRLSGECRATCCNALVAIGRPAVRPIAAAVADTTSRPAWLSNYGIRPGGAARTLLVQTIDRIEAGASSFIPGGSDAAETDGLVMTSAMAY
jgi:hypothetical protein